MKNKCKGGGPRRRVRFIVGYGVKGSGVVLECRAKTLLVFQDRQRTIGKFGWHYLPSGGRRVLVHRDMVY